MGKYRYVGYDVCLVHDCNLRCRYCSTGYGRWGGRPKTMSREMIDHVISFMIENGEDTFRVSFSGGETLLAFENLHYFVESMFNAKKKMDKKVLIELSTNGSNLTEDVADYLASKKVTLSFSLDGDRITNDRNRITRNGKGIYDDVIKSIAVYKNALEKNGCNDSRLKAECTIDESADLYESVRHLFDIGFSDVLARPVSDSLFTGYRKGKSFTLFLPSFRKLVRHIIEPLDVADILTGNYRQMLLNIEQVLPYILCKKEISPCSVVSDNLCISADGIITPCFLFNDIQDGRYTFGDVFSGVDRENASRIRASFDMLMSQCASCWCRSLCKFCYRELIDLAEQGISRDNADYCQLMRSTYSILIEEVTERYGLTTGFAHK